MTVTAIQDRGAADTPCTTSQLRLHIPEPRRRPGEAPGAVWLDPPPAGTVRKPPIDTGADTMRDLAFELIRVLDDDHVAKGPWNPELSPEQLIWALRCMLLTRAYDDRMFRAQRQGKTSFYMKGTGEEAVSIGQAMALDREDMVFPTYRQQALLIARGCPLDEMMCQVFSNTGDPLKGRQMPVFYSSRRHAFFSISGNLGTQFSQAVGWAMGSAYSHDTRIASAWTGEGATAEGDFHYALTLASVYRAPVVLNIVNNQWAISTFSGIANSQEATFAARALGYGLPALRVDGNDLLAVYAASRWAVERARSNLGSTVIEFVTYRTEGHSTSDDPNKYRPAGDASSWPLGDPVQRLAKHLQTLGALTEEQVEKMKAEVVEEVQAAYRTAETQGVLGAGKRPSVASMFDDVYKEMPWHLRRQREEAGL